MKRAALAACLALAAAPAARADASLLLGSTASAFGTQVAADLLRVPAVGLGAFATRWDSQDHGVLEGGGLRLGARLFGPLHLEARASYLESKDDGRETTLIPLEAVLVWRFRLGALAPYLGAGAGYYRKDAEYDGAEPRDASEEVAGYFGLAGLDLDLGPFTLFAEAKYNLVGTDDTLRWRGSDIEERNSLDGPSFAAGLKLGF